MIILAAAVTIEGRLRSSENKINFFTSCEKKDLQLVQL